MLMTKPKIATAVLLGIAILEAGASCSSLPVLAGQPTPTAKLAQPTTRERDNVKANNAKKYLIKTALFDRDPGWEAFNNRNLPKNLPRVTQDFGYSRTRLAGSNVGEIGGQVWRSGRPAYYAQTIPPRTLNDKLTASGTFALTASDVGSGVFFGWFNGESLGAGRNRNSLGWYLGGERDGQMMMVILLNGANRSDGAALTPFKRGVKFLPLKPDKSRHTWTLEYDPLASAGRGVVTASLDGQKPVVVELPPDFKKDGAIFNRFGMMNQQKSGGPVSVYVSDLKIDGKVIDLGKDPEWTAISNRQTFEDDELAGAQNFGFSNTHFAGAKKGEIGGVFWRVENPFSYYADRVGPLTLEDRLTSSGSVAFTVGAPDSGLCLGWFNSGDRLQPADRATNLLGIILEGPSRVGHYFRPFYATAKGEIRDPKTGPIIIPDGKKHTWRLDYDPAANQRGGVIRLVFDEQETIFPLAVGDRTRGATFDRFGLFTIRTGGSQVKAYFDDMKYTAGKKD